MATFQPQSGKLWSDDVGSPTSPIGGSALPQSKKSEQQSTIPTATVSAKPPSIPQTDGAAAPLNGSTLQEPEYSVQVKLADLQADPNNPLYSVSTFEALNL